MKTVHLELGQLGFIWVHKLDGASLFDDVDSGWIWEPCWPERLGHEPEWFEAELSQLQDYWNSEERKAASRGLICPSYKSDRRELMSW